MGYRDVQPALMPTALRGPYGQAYARALGIVKDFYAMQTRQAVQQRFPQYAAPDGQGAIGTERLIDQGNDIQLTSPETYAAYGARLRDSWNIWKLGGTAWGMLKAFAAQGYFPQLVCANGLIFSVTPGTLALNITQGAPLTFQIPFWNTFFVWFSSAPSSWTTITSPPTPTSVPSLYELRRLRRICINRWKPAWAICIGIAVLTSGTPGIWGAPGSTWAGAGATWDNAVVYWFSPADELPWGLPPNDTFGDYEWGVGLTWGDTAV